MSRLTGKAKKIFENIKKVQREKGTKAMMWELWSTVTYVLYDKKKIRYIKKFPPKMVENRILFETNDDFTDNGRALFDYLVKQGYNKKYEIVWLVHEPGKYKKYANLISRLEGVPDEKRTARFVCAIAAVLPNGEVLHSEGTIEGIIGYEEQGENGFGYDPIFYLPQYGCTTAQLEPDVKNELSHRGKALRAIKEQLRKYCEEGAYEDTDRQ